MRLLALLAFSLFTGFGIFAQNDSTFISIFISPIEDIFIEEEDSLIVVEEALLVVDDIDYEYSMFVAGFDTLNVSVFEVGFSAIDGSTVTEQYSLSEIDNSSEIERFGDSVVLPIGIYGFIDVYEYFVIFKNSEDEILYSLSDFYSNEE